jgi:DNA-directed RNA polymerase subunit alpha
MRIRWRGFELPTKVVCDETTRTDGYARFAVEPFERGFGTTIGNSLRRVLLSSLEGAGLTTVRFENVLHEFSAMDGVLEDTADIILNIKQLRIRMQDDEPTTLKIDVKKKGVITGADVTCEAGVEVANRDLHIATLTKTIHFKCDMTAEKGRGYRTAEENEKEGMEAGRIPIDAIFSPVLRVRYKTEDTRVGQRTNYDRLVLEIWTDQTISPEMALVEAAKILRKHLNPFVQHFELGGEMQESEPAAALSPIRPVLSEDLSAKLALPISELELSARSAHCLQSENIRTVGELVTYDEDRLLLVRNFGRTSLDEVKKKLDEFGLNLGMKLEGVEAESVAEEEEE